MPGQSRVTALPAAVAAVVATTASAGPLNFRDVTGARIIETVPELAGNEKAVEAGDFDNDGDLDVVIGNAHSDFGARRNKLYRNDDGVFVEISGPPAISGFETPDVTRAALLRDFDGDGWLDIAVVNDNNSDENTLYLNVQLDGMFSHFDDLGTTRFPPASPAAANGAVAADFDAADGPDLFIAAGPNAGQNRLWLNDGAGFFTDVTASNVPDDSGDYTVDAAAGDLNGDGTLDLLLGNHNTSGKAYYNDLPDTDSTGPGDFLYVPAGIQILMEAGANENALEPGDFDGDGLVDIYWSQAVGTDGDRVLRNTGVGGDGKATFDVLAAETLPASVTAVTSRKATVADLNDDGRPDVIVMKEDTGDARPTVLRNVSVAGGTTFVDWTPGLAFPAGDAHHGWHAVALDADGDGDLDIFLGGDSGDHLFENVPPDAFLEDDLPGQILPPLFNRNAAAVTGAAAAGEIDAYHTSDDEAGFISVILTGPDDYRLELQTDDHLVIGESDRGGAGVEEALQVDVAGPTKIIVEVLECGPFPGDLDGDCAVGVEDFLALLAAWGPAAPGAPADLDGDGVVGVLDFLELLSAWGGVSNEYLLEILTRG